MVDDASAPGSLAPDEIHLWRARLDRPFDSALADRLLSTDERSRRDAFRFQVHRHRFTVGRILLRMLLADYLSCDAADVVFVYGDRGKPRVARGRANRRLEFNVAHSDDQALYAFAWDRPVGIDVERVRADVDVDALAHMTMSPGERTLWARLAEPERRLAFFRAWARKEAVIKAIGEGLAIDLETFDVSVASGQPPVLTCLNDDPRLAMPWWLTDVEAGDGFMAAIAALSAPATVRVADLAPAARWPVALA